MPLNAYLPLEQVYLFHESAETWILRRFTPQVGQAAGAERTRSNWAEKPIKVFPDRTAKDENLRLQGQMGPKRATIYLRTRLLTTDTAKPQPADVVYDPLGGAWQAVSSGEWDEARGFAIVVQWVGRRGDGNW